MDHQLETIEVASGAFIGWAAGPGQVVRGYVTHYSADGGTDFVGRVCPLLSVELTEPAYSVNKDGARSDFTAGDEVSITCGQANLKRTIQGGRLQPGDYIELTYADTQKAANGTVKVFRLGVARQARPLPDAPSAVTPPSPASQVGGQPTAPANPPVSTPAVAPASAPAPAAPASTDTPIAKAKALAALGMTAEQIAPQLGLDVTVVATLLAA